LSERRALTVQELLTLDGCRPSLQASWVRRAMCFLRHLWSSSTLLSYRFCATIRTTIGPSWKAAPTRWQAGRFVEQTLLSARSLFRQFKRDRGQSPMAFLKDVRLRNARNMLARTDGTPSVTEVAVACGFSNLVGHFATDYFQRFSERPSDTLKRNKAVSPQTRLN
jgi:AraC-like DNA-binding protein